LIQKNLSDIDPLLINNVSKGHVKSMFTLAMIRLDVNSNDSTAIDLIKFASLRFHPESMHLLGIMYTIGNEFLDTNQAFANFWLSKAASLGSGFNQPKDKMANTFSKDFWDGWESYTPNWKYELQNQYGEVLENGFLDDGIIFPFLSAIENERKNASRMSNSNNNAIQLILTDGRITVYGGTMSSTLKIPWEFDSSTYIDITCSGQISLNNIVSSFAGTTGPEGLTGNGDYLLRMAKVDPDYPFGCVLLKRSDKDGWLKVGKSMTNIHSSEPYNIALSINSSSKNEIQGHFDVCLRTFLTQ